MHICTFEVQVYTHTHTHTHARICTYWGANSLGRHVPIGLRLNWIKQTQPEPNCSCECHYMTKRAIFTQHSHKNGQNSHLILSARDKAASKSASLMRP